MTPHEEKPISDEFIPLSAIERNIYEEQEEKQDTFDWEALLDEELAAAIAASAARHRTAVNEHSRNENELDYLASLDRATRKPTKLKISDNDMGRAVDKLSQPNENRAFDEPWMIDSATSRVERLQSKTTSDDAERKKRRNDALFLIIVGTSSLVGVLGLVAAAIFWFMIHRRAQTAIDVEYPSYGVTGPSSTSGKKISPSTSVSDRKLAQSAQMFHYQQQRQQILAQEKTHFDAKPVHSDDSDDEAPGGGGDYTVYECPGLAPTGEMEVRNPLFAEPDSSLTSSTSASHPTTNNHYPQPSTTTSSSSPPKEKLLS
ncbi:unnamed protein product [Rotaria sp. Silwood1]|nr:unnamed protein product [Rotaria sp. Silwood1]CAF0842946.1 unnamed protein product [Rotaria sp. Silwood1]CAF3364975.1 unnamed protein product [Rotaria sp. Silwood1]CAF3432123.1 unnamed protein product [Rotaria sp. Silwood1]CAF4498828.1 unnamed protein product [Rotaria sp. Silwood1]